MTQVQKPLRVGMVGCGLAAQFFHAPAYLRLGDIATVVAIADPDASKRAIVQGILAEPVAEYDSYQAMARHEEPDLFDIMLPHHLYAEAVQHLVSYHAALMLEKPFARTMDEANAIISASKNNVLSVMHNYLYGRRYQKAIASIQKGVVGEPRVVRLESLNTGMETIDPSLTTPWRDSKELSGGGTFHDHGYHLVYLARALMGSVVESVSAMMGNYGGHGNTLDTAVVTLRHKNGGMSVLMDGRLRGPTVAVEEVLGSRGTLTIPYAPASFIGFKNLLQTLPRVEALRQSPYARSTAACLQAFINSLEPGRPVPTSRTDALDTLRVVLAAQQSHDERRVISL